MFHLFRSRPSKRQIFNIGVTADITADEEIELNELEGIVKTALNSRRIDDLAVELDDFYELSVIEGNFFSH